MNYTIADIATLTGASWLQQGDPVTINHLLTDSRKLLFADSSIFFAIRTSSRDGHQFINRLYAQGVRSFVISQSMDPTLLPGANLLLVDDTLEALQQLASRHRMRFSIPVIGITGSNGKTIVKEWLNQLLENDFRIVRSPRSYNSQLGVPLSVCLMDPVHELAIFEAGISRPGEMNRLAAIIQPTIGIFTNLGLAHSEGFRSQQEKLEEKWKLFDSCSTIIYHKDGGIIDKWVATLRDNGPEIFSWGTTEECAMQVLPDFRIRYRNTEFQLRMPFTDEASIENTLHCVACLLYLGIPETLIPERIVQLKPVSMRLELKEGIHHCSVINDSYSADISSLTIALDFLSQQQQHLRKTVILSDIPETGLSAARLYEKVASLLHRHGIQRLLAIGPVISEHLHYFEEKGIHTRKFISTDAFVNRFDEIPFQEETILVKGARRFGFETITALLEMQEHQTVLEINLNALLNNLRQYQQLLSPGIRLMAMVKAFSYGTGSFEIANLLQFHGVDYLAVAYTDEGVALRRAGIHLPIMVMNAAPSGFAALLEHNLEPVLYSLPLFRQFGQYIRQEGLNSYPVHLEMETGMNRLGFATGDLPELTRLLPVSGFKVQSVFSHLAASEDPAHDDFSRHQVRLFEQACLSIATVVHYPFLRHIENTAAIQRKPGWQFDMVRLGIGLYGIDSAGTGDLHLMEVATLKTTIAQIKTLGPEDTVGYGRRGRIDRPSRIATVRIGYADGYPRSLGNGRGRMLVAGKEAPVIGSICMDMTMLDITGIGNVNEGDEVIVFGGELTVSRVAEWAATIAYEMLTGISQRVKRIYYQD
ncbi:bifunctional UDP-N-acetylmuramoyl-tripeptide:D-alanyl-D-alanine ligase/alanine racemase [Flavihumibacter petaseus]|uniref:Alanine racemase n=1 Tax=Flavihumibacter petaseus NBRC 106054 TaxID=1220578 RepID=A0A0E9MVQ3_9BACT|nr:bifunctional UDP-N-acetylmuramoyl-tripeptide:D-alanyl-D-alanine ligase/alanine racemase [Flavihumibacter petaseus]GAO41664.1 putative UDP-N-acetylmuramoyl-tripeptide--D-alanyl-D-alanine ligase/alanine racemase [Flavihumibacter petaseus NBRC 106054]